MFQLIVAVISIVLVAALAIASIFYGGEAFVKSSEKAVVTTLVNQAQQISGASALYRADNGVAATIEGLAVGGEYLAAAPAGTKVTDGDWSIVNDHAYIAFDAEADVLSVCDEVLSQSPNGEAGFCSDATAASIDTDTDDDGTADDVTGVTGFAFAL